MSAGTYVMMLLAKQGGIDISEDFKVLEDLNVIAKYYWIQDVAREKESIKQKVLTDGNIDIKNQAKFINIFDRMEEDIKKRIAGLEWE